MLFKSLKLGQYTFPSNVVQGPLAGYSCAPFRRLFWRYGGLGFAMSEMISAHDLMHRQTKPPRYLYRDPAEKFCAYQISGTDPKAIAFATRVVTDAGADLIDLNCGCPVTKIRRKGAGSKLLEQPVLLAELIRAMKDSTDKLISIKIRIPSDNNDFDLNAVLETAEQNGVDLLTVHGRHWSERYDVDCDIAAIRDVVRQTRIPVLANGDVDDYASLKRLYEETGCAGVMICRAGVGQPWLFQQLMCEHEGKVFTKPNIAERSELFLEHVRSLIELESEKTAVLQSRKLAKYYMREVPGSAEFTAAMQQVTSLEEMEALLKSSLEFENSQL